MIISTTYPEYIVVITKHMMQAAGCGDRADPRDWLDKTLALLDELNSKGYLVVSEAKVI